MLLSKVMFFPSTSDEALKFRRVGALGMVRDLNLHEKSLVSHKARRFSHRGG